jgi:hypothetical protein
MSHSNDAHHLFGAWPRPSTPTQGAATAGPRTRSSCSSAHLTRFVAAMGCSLCAASAPSMPRPLTRPRIVWVVLLKLIILHLPRMQILRSCLPAHRLQSIIADISKSFHPDGEPAESTCVTFRPNSSGLKSFVPVLWYDGVCPPLDKPTVQRDVQPNRGRTLSSSLPAERLGGDEQANMRLCADELALSPLCTAFARSVTTTERSRPRSSLCTPRTAPTTPTACSQASYSGRWAIGTARLGTSSSGPALVA